MEGKPSAEDGQSVKEKPSVKDGQNVEGKPSAEDGQSVKEKPSVKDGQNVEGKPSAEDGRSVKEKPSVKDGQNAEGKPSAEDGRSVKEQPDAEPRKDGANDDVTGERQSRRDAGVVDRAALEMRCTGNCTGGSNPSLSATKKRCKSSSYEIYTFFFTPKM